MSNINTSNISVTFPVAGVDNDTQGFRNNFANIVSALNEAAVEITQLQTTAVLSANLSTGAVTVNNLGGSTISNGIFNEFYGLTYPSSGLVSTVSTATNIDLTNGPFQSYSISGNVPFTFINWPSSGRLGVVRIAISNSTGTSYSATFFTANNGTIHYGTNTRIFQNPLTVPAVYTAIVSGSVVSGSTTFNLYSTTGLKTGLVISGTGISVNTTITSISGNTITISNPTTASLTDQTLLNVEYTGLRLLEAWSSDGGANVYITNIADF